jgi:chromosome segregation ATPase
MAKTDTRELIGKVIAGLQDLLERYDEVIEVTTQINTVKASLASVNAAHDKALAELTEQQAQLETAKADLKRQQAVNEDLSAKGTAQLAALVDKRNAQQAEIDAQMTLHNNLIASMGSIRAKLDSMVRPN